MFKINKFLIKRGLKSIFLSKTFSFLMMFLIIISGSVYTMLESTSNALNNSYINVIWTGQLHDAIIKENFKFKQTNIENSNLEIIPWYQDKKEENKLKIEDLKKALFKNPKNNEKYYQFNLKIGKNSKGIYEELKLNPLLEPIKIYKNKLSNKEIFEKVKENIQSIKSKITLNLENNLSKKYIENIKVNYENELFIKETKSIFVSKNRQAYKVVQHNNLDNINKENINKMIIYDGVSKFFKPLTKNQIETELKNKLGKKGKTLSYINKNYYLNNDKGYKYFLNHKNGLEGEKLNDPSSFQAIVSPAYANENAKKTISNNKLKELFDNDSKFMDDLKQDVNNIKYQKYKEKLIFVDNMPFFIIGIGTTPDFAYPIIDHSLPLVDAKNQAIVFTSKKGFQRIEDAFRSNSQENYISIKFKKNVNMKRQEQILKEIEKKTRDGTYPLSYYPEYIKIVNKINDVTEQTLLTQNRTIILEKVKKNISSISFSTTTLLIVFLLNIIIMIFKVLIIEKRKIFATMNALGYSKWKIASSNGLATILLTIIPAIISYGIGYGLQFMLLEKISILWTIPTYPNSFSLVSILITILIPSAMVFFIILFTTIYELRYPISQMLNNTTQKYFNKLTKIITKIRFLSIKGKYIVSLSLKNMDKLILITISAFISLISLMIGFGTIFKTQKAYTITAQMSNYEFAIDLTTPTIEGGQYQELKKNNIVPIKNNIEKNNLNNNNARWHIPKILDVNLTTPNLAENSENLQKASKYLKNKLQLKAVLINNPVGGINTWNIAKRLMPDNQLKKAEKNYNQIEEERKKTKKTLNSLIYEQTQSKNNENIPYIISYNQVITNQKDEKYTYIDGNFLNKKTKLRIKGLNLNTKMINILKKLKNANLYKGELPILINKYIAEKWDIYQGNFLDIAINNHAKRNTQTKPPIIKAKVVSIIDGYNENGIYTLRNKANNILGLETNGFNGIFTFNKKPALLRTLPLYSNSGIYPATDTFTGNWETFLNNYLLNSKEWKNKKTKITNATEFYQKYSRTPFTSTINKVKWNTIDKATFKNISEFVFTIIVLIEITSIVLSTIFTIIVASLIFKSNKKKIATLWTLGYRRYEISKIFLSMYIIPLIIAFVFAVPMSLLVLLALRKFIINFGNILIPFAVSWWMPILSFVLISMIFIVVTLITIFNKKPSTNLEAFKGD